MRADARLAVPTAVAWVMLAALLGVPQALTLAAGGAWLVVGLLVAWLCGGRMRAATAARRRGVNQVLLSLVLGATMSALVLTSAAILQDNRSPELLLRAADAGLVVRATAVTTQTIHPDDSWFFATVQSGTAGTQKFSAAVPVMVFGELDSGAGIGTEVRLVGTLEATAPGDDIAFLYFLDGDMRVSRGPPWYLGWATALRGEFLTEAATLPGDGGRLLPGLAIGDTSAVDQQLDEAMKVASLSHLTAVSGANCAVVIGLVVFGGAAIGLPRGWRIGVAVVVLMGFVVLVTPEPSVLRAAVMASLALVSMASGRQTSGLPVLALAVAILLVCDPWLARNYGFVLSVCATAGLLLLTVPISRRLFRWMPRPLAVMIAVPVAAQLACQPVLIMLAPSIPSYGVVANILAGPAAPVATVLGLVVCLLIPVAPALVGPVAQLAWVPAAWIAAVATYLSDLPGARLPWPSGGWGVLLVLVVTALGLVAWLGAGRSLARWRRVATVALALIVVVYLGVSGGEQLRRRLAPPRDWAIAACDVGQGDAVLVRSAGRVALIDTGPHPAALDYCLDTLGISWINILVLTHFDLDHVGGISAVEGRVDRVLVGPSSGQRDDRVVHELAAAGASVTQAVQGTHGVLGQLRWKVLWPPSQLVGIEPGNEASVVVEFSGMGECAGGCLTSLFLGDLGEEAQTRMLAMNRLGQVDVVKVAHHGSRDQSGQLYDRVHAAVGLIGVGLENDYGHPNPDTLDMLSGVGTLVGRTDLNGMVLVSMQHDVLQLWVEHQHAGTPE